jgi:hypothetical protein
MALDMGSIQYKPPITNVSPFSGNDISNAASALQGKPQDTAAASLVKPESTQDIATISTSKPTALSFTNPDGSRTAGIALNGNVSLGSLGDVSSMTFDQALAHVQGGQNNILVQANKDLPGYLNLGNNVNVSV